MIEKSCKTCEYKRLEWIDVPCRFCGQDHNHWQPKEETKIDENEFEDLLEKAYWYFNNKLSKKNFSDRDCFKMAYRKHFKPEHLKPKEREMRKPIFESEEEVTQFYNLHCLQSDNLTQFKESLKSFGLIKKSPVEEAEDMYGNLMQIENIDGTSIETRLSCYEHLCEKRYKGLVKCYQAIQYQDKRINELEKQLEEKQ